MPFSGNWNSLGIARLPGAIDKAMRSFRRLTGLTAVATVVPSMVATQLSGSLLPPVHPLCARRLGATATCIPPCGDEWRKHLAFARGRRHRRHVCPLGLRCASVPIMLADSSIVGIAKCVAGPETSDETLASGIGVLEVVVSRSCREIEVVLLREEVRRLAASLELARRTDSVETSIAGLGSEGLPANPAGEDSASLLRLIDRIVRCLNDRYTDPRLRLDEVAQVVNRNDKYIAHLFATSTGIRMRAYVTTLRLRRARELLLYSSRPIEQIARDSGFAQVARFRELFRRTIGVRPSQYREIFAEPGRANGSDEVVPGSPGGRSAAGLPGAGRVIRARRNREK